MSSYSITIFLDYFLNNFSQLICNLIFFFSISGLVFGQVPSRNFHRKPGRTENNAPKPTPKPVAIDADDESSDCPEPNGYFADAEQCDKYYACK